MSSRPAELSSLAPGRDLAEDRLDDTWSLGLRGSTSYAGAVFRLGFSITGPDAAIFSPLGANPSYVDLPLSSGCILGKKAR